MKHLGMLPGGATKPPKQRIVEKSERVYAPAGGMVFFSVVAGSDVNEGDELGCILSTAGTVKNLLRAPKSGVLTWCRAIPVVWLGELIASIRQVAEVLEND